MGAIQSLEADSILQEQGMPYSELMIAPMREDLVKLGFKEMRTPEDVEGLLESEGTVLVAVNSVCGCSAGGMRPGMALALQNAVKPEVLTTVFAGQELEATEKAREYFVGFPPSSPCVAILKDGALVYMMERHQIEGHSHHEIAEALRAAFDEHCAA
jgi:putative YphP/YqiW family bacilliredoxin